MTELQGIFDNDQPEAETGNQAEAVEETTKTPDEGPQTESVVEDPSEDNTEEKPHEQQEDAETSSQDSGDDTKPELEQVKITLDDTDYDVDLPSDIAEKVKNGVMMEHVFRKNTQELADQRRTFEAEQAEGRQKQQEMLTEMAAQLMFMQNEFDTPEMKQLEQFHKAEYDQKKADYNSRFEAYKKFVEDHGTATAKESEQEQQKFRQDQAEKMNMLVPEWLDEGKRKADAKVIMNYAKSVGFEPKEMQSIAQARLMKVFRDASLYNQAQENLKSKKSKPSVTSVKASPKPTQVKEKSLEDIFYGGG